MAHINQKIKRFWGISEVGFSLMATMETTFFVFFLTDVSKLPLYIVAVITGSSALIDAVSAVLAGIFIDKVQLKRGKYRPWLLYCPPLVVAFFVLMFTKIGGDITAGLICGLGYIISHFIWNVAWTANRNLVPVLSDVTEEKSFLSARLGVGGSAGRILASYAVPALSSILFVVMSGVSAYTMIALISSVVFALCYFIHYAITKGYDTADDKIGGKAVTFKDMGRSIIGNKYLIILLVHDALRLLAYYVIASSATYFAKIVIGDAGQASWLLMLFYLGCVIGSSFSQRVVVKYGSKKSTLIGMVGWLILQGICFFLPANIFIICGVLFVSQLFFGVAYGLTTNLYAMCGAYSEWKTGESARGVIMSFCSLAIKTAIALRGVLITAVLGFIAYDVNATVVTESAQMGIRALFAGAPVVAIVLSLIPLAMFDLTDERVEEMEREISQRKQKILQNEA